MATSAALLRKRAPADGRGAKKLGATRLADPQARRPFAGAPLPLAALRCRCLRALYVAVPGLRQT